MPGGKESGKGKKMNWTKLDEKTFDIMHGDCSVDPNSGGLMAAIHAALPGSGIGSGLAITIGRQLVCACNPIATACLEYDSKTEFGHISTANGWRHITISELADIFCNDTVCAHLRHITPAMRKRARERFGIRPVSKATA